MGQSRIDDFLNIFQCDASSPATNVAPLYGSDLPILNPCWVSLSSAASTKSSTVRSVNNSIIRFGFITSYISTISSIGLKTVSVLMWKQKANDLLVPECDQL